MVSVRNDGTREAMESIDGVEEGFSHTSGSEGMAKRDKVVVLGEQIDNN